MDARDDGVISGMIIRWSDEQRDHLSGQAGINPVNLSATRGRVDSDMAELTIKNLPDDVYERLKESAEAQHRSVAKEALELLERAHRYRPTAEDGCASRRPR